MSITIRGCHIGEGRPKVIIPIVEVSESKILERALEFSELCIDCVEWRIDWFEQCNDMHSVVSCLQKIRVALKDKLLLVTFRTKDEGGEVSLTHQKYLDFINTVIDTDCADLIDIEFLTAGNDIRKLIDNAHSSGAVVVCSSHDFQKTPDKSELVSRMVKMQQVGADLPKVAVMPHDSTDVLTLLAATVEMKNKYFATPIIAISMGKLDFCKRWRFKCSWADWAGCCQRRVRLNSRIKTYGVLILNWTSTPFFSFDYFTDSDNHSFQQPTV